LREAVVFDEHVVPDAFDQVLLCDRHARVGHQEEQYIEVTIGQIDGFGASVQHAAERIELE
jgi:hypothetical protein